MNEDAVVERNDDEVVEKHVEELGIGKDCTEGRENEAEGRFVKFLRGLELVTKDMCELKL